jgi:Ser/Thr protein kinase RdoA (MazF antagonist)
LKKEIEALMNPQLVRAAASKWSAKGKIELLDDVANYVYQFQDEDGWKILRITHSSHRTENQIIAELDWVKFLFKNGVQVALPHISMDQHLTETFPVSDSYFTAVVFDFAPGQFVDEADPASWNPDLFHQMGVIMGRMHRLSKDYNPEDLKEKRPNWLEDDLVKNARHYLPTELQTAADDLEELIQRFNQFPLTKETYGLIHSDVNPTNFHVLDGKITLFDFDDCAYNWFVNDIAVVMPLYSSMYSKPDWEEQINGFVYWFMQGYRSENNLDDGWLDFLPTCLRLQNIITLVAMFEANIPGSRYNSFYELVLKTYREGHPLFEFDFRNLL